jgi:hypothetical protein
MDTVRIVTIAVRAEAALASVGVSQYGPST